MKLSFSTGLVEGLQYLTITRPDTSFAVNRVCQFIQHPTDKHWGAIKRILKYFKGSINLGLHFQKSNVAKMASHVIFQYIILAIDDTHNTWTNVIVKMTILRLLGSSDDKEKRGVARPEGPPLRGFR